MKILYKSIIIAFLALSCSEDPYIANYEINGQGYFHKPGVDVMVFQDFYPDGHQGGITIIQNGTRVAANGDLRLEATPGQWSPMPAKGPTVVDSAKQQIKVTLWYPDSSKNRKGFNPINYPDLNFRYDISVEAKDDQIDIQIDLEEPLPDEWYGKVGFNIELFPGYYFGKTWRMDDKTGLFPRQVNSEYINGKHQPLVEGNELIVAPEDKFGSITFSSATGNLSLWDGRNEHNNGWFVVRTLLQPGKLEKAAQLGIAAKGRPDFKAKPVIQVSQVGYKPNQPKRAIIERDPGATYIEEVVLQRITPDGSRETVKRGVPVNWGKFLRFQYDIFDFSEIKTPGAYQVIYGEEKSSVFFISEDVFDHDVWQPTLAYYLPVQMCHMRINDRYKVWYGACHLDDALMAPRDLNHFDGYVQGPETLTSYASGQHVPGLNQGGWHDAGDYDLRVESQATTVERLAEMYLLFQPEYDGTSVDWENNIVEMHRPDGVPDILQQIDHGLRSIVGGYETLGRFYRGIICKDLRQYTLLGDASVMTDNKILSPANPDDRWVFTENNPDRTIRTATSLAIASRAIEKYNKELSLKCLKIAQEQWQQFKTKKNVNLIPLAISLYQVEQNSLYLEFLTNNIDLALQQPETTAPFLARIFEDIKSEDVRKKIKRLMQEYATEMQNRNRETPYGVEYRPNIWGAGWAIQEFGHNWYYLHKGFPELFDAETVLNAFQFILGVHPGRNQSSFVSGVGAQSVLVAYGVNRDEWSYIPGGSVSGTNLVRPDFPELKVWPYFWQQTEYVMGGGATNFMFLALAAGEIENIDKKAESSN